MSDEGNDERKFIPYEEARFSNNQRSSYATNN